MFQNRMDREFQPQETFQLQETFPSMQYYTMNDKIDDNRINPNKIEKGTIEDGEIDSDLEDIVPSLIHNISETTINELMSEYVNKKVKKYLYHFDSPSVTNSGYVEVTENIITIFFPDKKNCPNDTSIQSQNVNLFINNQ